jgi:hypothetical protein
MYGHFNGKSHGKWSSDDQRSNLGQPISSQTHVEYDEHEY